MTQGSFKELLEKLPIDSTDAEEAKAAKETAEDIEDLQDSLKAVEGMTPEEAKESSAMSKFRRFIKDLESAGDTVGKTIRGVKKGAEIARELASYYNEIAKWCGLT